MSNPTKIVVIGAGSAQFSSVLIRDICLTEGLHNSTVVLVDIDQSRLDTTYRFAKRYAAEMKVNINFEIEKHSEAALENAQFVVNVAFKGGHTQMENERALLSEKGYYHGIGVHAPFRQLDLMLEIAREVERICPDAYLLQCSNPLVEGCTLMTRETKAKVIGLCHGHFDYRAIAETLQLDLQHVTCEAIGLNHCIWLTEFRYKGKNAYPLIDKWIENESERYWQAWQPTCSQVQMSPASIDLYRLYGLMPIGDTCRASWPESWWYHVDDKTKKKWWGLLGGFDGEEGWNAHLKELQEQLNKIQTAVWNSNKKLSTVFPPKKSFEQIVYIIDAIANDKRDVFQVNVPNRGAIPGLPNDFVVEVPAVIDGSGVQPLITKPLPDAVMFGTIIPRWLYAERLILAHQTGDKRLLLQTYLSDQRTRTREQAENAIDALMGMPGNEDMSRHYDHQCSPASDDQCAVAVTEELQQREENLQPYISIVIPSYNSASYIQHCLSSVSAQDTKLAYEIIVVDSSNDGTDKIIAKKFPNVKLIHFDHQVRVGAARNIGAEKAKGEIVLFLDTDCIAPSTWIDQMYVGFEEYRADGICGSFENGTPWSIGGCLEYYLEFFRFLAHQGEAYTTPFLLGGNSGYKKDIFTSAQYYTNVSFGSDYLFSWPLAKQGRNLMALPSAAVRHSNTTGFLPVLRKQHKLGLAACYYRYRTSPELMQLFERGPFLVFLFPFVILPWIGLHILQKRGAIEFGKYLVLLPFLLVANFSWSLGFYQKLVDQNNS